MVIICRADLLVRVHEGQYSQWLNSQGINAAVIEVPSAVRPRWNVPRPMSRTCSLLPPPRGGVSVKQIGVMGFSAGGHLAATRLHTVRRRRDKAVLHPCLPGHLVGEGVGPRAVSTT